MRKCKETLLLLCLFLLLWCPAHPYSWHQLDGWQYEFLALLNAPAPWMLEQIHADLASLSPQEMSREAMRRFIDEYSKCKDHFLLIHVTIRANHFVIHTLCSVENNEMRRVR